DDDDAGVTHQPRVPAAGGFTLQFVFGCVADEAARIAHLVHHRITAVDAQCAVDALVLQAVADIDAGGADLHADLAVDAIPEIDAARVNAFLARTARITAPGVIRHDQRVGVEHHRLEARIRTH